MHGLSLKGLFPGSGILGSTACLDKAQQPKQQDEGQM